MTQIKESLPATVGGERCNPKMHSNRASGQMTTWLARRIDVLIGGGGADTLYGGAGNDFIAGDSEDTPEAQQGNDQLFGEDGNDELQGFGGDDRLDGGTGDDRLFGGKGDDTISGGDGKDYPQGDEGNDTLDGSDGIDIIHGNDGDDTIFGGAGDDRTSLGGGLAGEAGNDTYLFSRGWDMEKEHEHRIGIPHISRISRYGQAIVWPKLCSKGRRHHAIRVAESQVLEYRLKYVNLCEKGK